MNKLDVCYVALDNYIIPTLVSTISLFESNQNICEINIHIITKNITKQSEKYICDISNKYGQKINIYDISDKLTLIEHFKICKEPSNNEYGSALSSFAYARFFISELLPNDVKRVLYIDSDTLIVGDLSELINFDIHDKIAAVIDTWTSEYNRVVGLSETDLYFSAAIQLIDLKKWRKENYTRTLLAYTEQLERGYRLFDQDIMNVLLHDKITVLPLEYNMQFVSRKFSYMDIYSISGKNDKNFYNPAEIQIAKENVKIIHYAGDIMGKPWICPNFSSDTKKWKRVYNNSLLASSGYIDNKQVGKSIKNYLKYLLLKFDFTGKITKSKFLNLQNSEMKG